MQDGWITAGYNALNQPTAMWSPAYPGGESAHWMRFGYDPLGRCVKRWKALGNGTPVTAASYYYYDGWNLIQEGPSGGMADRIYVHGGRMDEIVASQAGGVWSHHHYDARGHCIMLTNTIDGGIREQYEYDAFGYPYFYSATGAKLAPSAQWGNRFLFTGREWLKDLKVYDYRNRMYQPELGRFLQPDPEEFEAGDYNLYRYCHNDPVNKSDPTGLTPLVNLTIQGHGDWDFDNGRVAMAQIALQRSAAKQSEHDATINGLKKQLDGSKDTVSQTVPTKEGPQVINGTSQVKVPKGGRSSGNFGYEPIGEERLNLRADATKLGHAHTDESEKAALPTGHDFKAARDAGPKRELYFTSRYLARHGADPTGRKGNYIILRSTGSHRLDIPSQVYRFDQRLFLPPLSPD